METIDLGTLEVRTAIEIKLNNGKYLTILSGDKIITQEEIERAFKAAE